MWTKIKEYIGKNKKKAVVAVIFVVAGVVYCINGEDIGQDKIVEMICNVIGC